MLQSLYIKNYALIQELTLNPTKGLNIITGETGAGKSIMLGAIGLLLGNRADSKVLFEQEEKCIIEGEFQIEDYNLKSIFDAEELDYEILCTIRREISPQGKSRAFVNDTPVTLDVLKKLGEKLMDVHSQHETLLLGDSDFQTDILDIVSASKNDLSNYAALFKSYKKLSKRIEDLDQQILNEKKELDYHSFLLNELQKAVLKSGEQESLEEELIVLENAEEIKSKLSIVSGSFENEDVSILSLTETALKSLDQLSSFSANLSSLKERLESVLIELKDINNEAFAESESVEVNNERTEELRERLSLIFNLLQKHNARKVDELLGIQQELEEKVQKAGNLDEELASIKIEIQKVEKQLLSSGKILSEKRKSVVAELEKQLVLLLNDLGMPNAVFQIKIEPCEPSVSGLDKITFLFSANKGIPAQELKNAASGGEFSRLMLCFKYILASKTNLPVIVFDEIDTGISGEIAIKVGKMLKQMANGHQIISISHLPQIAALGDAHYFVYKKDLTNRSVSSIRKLDDTERLHHLAVMIGGANPSQTAVNSAKELMDLV
jgi:DNA repair protein RecN (Recombination protein N)